MTSLPRDPLPTAVQLQRPFDPVVTFRNSQGESARGTITSLQRHSLVMEVYNPYSIVQVSEVLNELTIRSSDQVVYCGRAVVSSLLNTGLMAVVSIALVEEWADLEVTGGRAPEVGTEAQRFVEGWFDRFRLRRGYLVAVSEIRAFLAEVSRWTDQADLADSLPRDKEGRLDAGVFQELASPILRAGANYFAALEQEIGAVRSEEESSYKVFAQTSLHPLILRAPFVYRTFAKPLGYAGDYQMVNQILGDPQQGPTTYFQLINTLFLQSAVAQAHRNRIDILVDYLLRLNDEAKLRGRPARLLNIGCGPAVEIQRVLRSLGPDCMLSFRLVDFSQETLAYTRSQIEQACGDSAAAVSVDYVNDSVHNLLKRSVRNVAGDEPSDFDFVYCAGLFDYLSDKVCARLLDYLSARTRPGGRVLVTNVHPSNQQKGVMDHVLEWHLIYRDEPQLAAVLPRARHHERLYTDATGVNVFAEFVKPPAEGEVPS